MSSAAAARSRVLSAYRRLNRARLNLFRGDDFAMKVSREQMRTEFIKNRNVNPAGPEWEAMVAGIDEAAQMLQHEVLRGDLNPQTGRYGASRNKHRTEKKEVSDLSLFLSRAILVGLPHLSFIVFRHI